MTVLLLAVGLWPLDFSPKNQVTWLSGENGLRFKGESLISGRTVGGFVSSAGAAAKGDSEERGFSIEIWLRSAEDDKGGVPRFLSFVDDSQKTVLLLGQWRSSLIIRRPVPGYDVREKWKEIGLGEALPKGVRRLITVASDGKGTIIYLDGKRARTYPDFNLDDGEPSIRRCSLILGNAPSGKASWSGDVFGLSLYNTALNESEAMESFRRWTKGKKGPNPHSMGEAALYLFREGTGNQVENAIGTRAPLMIPLHPAYHNEILSRPMFNKYTRMSYLGDVVLNVLGFIPFGFCVSLWMMQARQCSRGRTFLIAVCLGASVSLTIEVVQAFIPVRDSSVLDLGCNAAGAAIGASLSVFAVCQQSSKRLAGLHAPGGKKD